MGQARPVAIEGTWLGIPWVLLLAAASTRAIDASLSLLPKGWQPPELCWGLCKELLGLGDGFLSLVAGSCACLRYYSGCCVCPSVTPEVVAGVNMQICVAWPGLAGAPILISDSTAGEQRDHERPDT